MEAGRRSRRKSDSDAKKKTAQRRDSAEDGSAEERRQHRRTATVQRTGTSAKDGIRRRGTEPAVPPLQKIPALGRNSGRNHYLCFRLAKKFGDKLRRFNPFTRPATLEELPKPLPANPDQRLVKVYVEGYEDVAFWRGIFDHFQNPYLRFEISVPNRADLPKGKKVLMGMIPRSSEELILCVDSDFDFLFADRTEQSREVNAARYMFHTYAYATENYLCYAPSLHNVCVKATKNDTRIFDFERFMADYSRTIYRLFLWYAYSAKLSDEHVFTLVDFKSAVRIGYLDLENNGEKTLAWLQKNVAKREEMLRRQATRKMIDPMLEFEQQLKSRGLTPENAYLFMHGHTLMDNVVMVLLETVCEKLRQMTADHCLEKGGRGAEKRNEQLHQYPAIDPGRTARQRELHQMSALQAAPARHREIHCPHDLEHEAQRRNPRRLDMDHPSQHAAGIGRANDTRAAFAMKAALVS